MALRALSGRGRTLSATMGPLVARVSAAMTTPPSKRHPTIVVPVLVALGSGIPWAWSAALRLWLLKSKPPIVRGCARDCGTAWNSVREAGSRTWVTSGKARRLIRRR
jgi:hypothetical protein